MRNAYLSSVVLSFLIHITAYSAGNPFDERKVTGSSEDSTASDSKSDCVGEAALKLAELLKKDQDANILGRLFEWTATKMAYRVVASRRENGKPDTLEDYARIQAKNLQFEKVSEDVQKLYTTYGLQADLEKLKSRLDTSFSNASYYKNGPSKRLKFDESSTLVLALALNERENNLETNQPHLALTQADAGVIWAVEKLRKTKGYQLGSAEGNLLTLSTRVAHLVAKNISVTKDGNRKGDGEELQADVLAQRARQIEESLRNLVKNHLSDEGLLAAYRTCKAKQTADSACTDCKIDTAELPMIEQRAFLALMKGVYDSSKVTTDDVRKGLKGVAGKLQGEVDGIVFDLTPKAGLREVKRVEAVKSNKKVAAPTEVTSPPGPEVSQEVPVTQATERPRTSSEVAREIEKVQEEIRVSEEKLMGLEKDKGLQARYEASKKHYEAGVKQIEQKNRELKKEEEKLRLAERELRKAEEVAGKEIQAELLKSSKRAPTKEEATKMVHDRIRFGKNPAGPADEIPDNPLKKYKELESKTNQLRLTATSELPEDLSNRKKDFEVKKAEYEKVISEMKESERKLELLKRESEKLKKKEEKARKKDIKKAFEKN